jgi:hypothetical protein
MSGDALGTLALLAAPVFAGLFLIINRRREPRHCRHAGSPGMCYHARCANGVLNWFEVASACMFLFTMGAGLAYLNDPGGWLRMSTPLTTGF